VFLPCLDPHLFSVSLISFSCFPPLFHLSRLSFFQMAKNKRKANSTVARRQESSPTPVVVPKIHDHDGDGSSILVLTVAPATEPSADPCAPRPVPPPLPPSPPRDVGPSSPHPALSLVVTTGSKLLHAALVDACAVVSDDEILDEDQLDFNFSDEECVDSPQATAPLPAQPVLSPAPLLPVALPPPPPLPPLQSGLPTSFISGGGEPAPTADAGKSPSASSSGKWHDLFHSNRSSGSCTKLQNFSLNHLSRTCVISPEDIQPQFEVWKFCAVGYISGKNPGYRALHNLISHVWKCEATLTIHESGWLVYRFQTEEAKLSVLRGRPYLVYGRPLVLRPMTKFFDFSSAEMSRVPVWVRFPNLPLCYWSPVCLSKIASVIGRPIQCDQLTSNLSRMSYARVLVEIDLLEELRHSVEITLLEGLTLHQKVVYETLPKYCNFCHVLGHTRLLCSKAAASINLVPCLQPNDQPGMGSKETVFGRVGPQPPSQVPPPLMQSQPQDHHTPVASEVEAVPAANLDPSTDWIPVESRKSSKQRKGKVVVISAPEPADNSPATPCPPVCTADVQCSPRPNPLVTTPGAGAVQGSSPPCTPPLAVLSCEGAAHISPSRPPFLENTTGDTVVVGNSVAVPVLDLATQCGVRTRNQRQRGRSGRASPSPAQL